MEGDSLYLFHYGHQTVLLTSFLDDLAQLVGREVTVRGGLVRLLEEAIPTESERDSLQPPETMLLTSVLADRI